MLQDYLETEGLQFEPATGLWTRVQHGPFAYSDGDASEMYIEACVNAARDLASNSFELEARIRDWPSEYHLTRCRAQLLKNFAFDRSSAVLEVGAGCGAITRYLGETFAHAIGVEGSARRARIARARTRDQANVELVCSRFQDLRFKARFDVVFVIGVLEYAAMFSDGSADPYAAFLQRCSELLTEEGVLVLAIENQFGLKYFAGMGEDHTGKPFDGIEGYASRRNAARTFGRAQLEQRLSHCFAQVAFYYPFPDYKIPSAVLSEAALNEIGAQGIAGLIGGMRSRDYMHDRRRAMFDEALVWQELASNRASPFFAPSFLVLAGKSRNALPRFSELGVFYSEGRRPEFQTSTRIARNTAGRLQTRKTLESGAERHFEPPLVLRQCVDDWHDRPSLLMTLRRRRKTRGITLAQLFEPCAPWFEWLHDERRGRDTLEGDRIDCIWRNTFVVDDRCVFIDREWSWQEPIGARALVVRSIYDFLYDRARLTRGVPALEDRSGAALIAEIAELFDIALGERDFNEFVDVESRMRALIFGRDPRWVKRSMLLKLKHPRTFDLVQDLRQLGSTATRRAESLRLQLARRARRYSRALGSRATAASRTPAAE